MKCFAVVAGLFLSFAVAGCVDEERKSGLGESCTKSADCDKVLICISLVCVQDPTSGIGSDLEHKLGLVWKTIPGGTYEMGCSPNDVQCSSSEVPPHMVTVSAFELLETEVTQAQYEGVTEVNPSDFAGCPECPVETVTWHEAKEFCEGIGGRLPSEAEWEYAARAGTLTATYGGDDETALQEIAWYDANSGSATQVVKTRTPNGFGLYDMLGNLFEWNEDCWHWDYNEAPSTGGVWAGGKCDFRVLRGGSWYTSESDLRVSVRNNVNPDNKSNSLGFRCAR